MNSRSLRFRLIGWFAVLLFGVCFSVGIYTYYGLQHYLYSNLRTGMQRRTAQIGHNLLPLIEEKGEPFVIEAIKNGFAPEANDRYFRITRKDGSIFYASGQSRSLSFNPNKIPLLNRNFRPADGELFLNSSLLFIADEFPQKSGESYLIEMGAPYTAIQATLRGLLEMLALGLPVIAAMAVGGAYALVGRALLPMKQSVEAAEKISLRHLDQRLPVAKTGDELEQLSLALNRMLGRLEDSFQQTNRFAADASHELRTPLTIMRGELEVAMQQANPSPRVRETIASMLEETERLGKVVEGLLAVSRLEAGQAQLQCELLDLAELTRATLEQMSLLAEEKKIQLNIANLQPTRIDGDAARLRQVVVNLVDNAIKYTGTGGSIEISVMPEENSAILRVKDTGIGIPEDMVGRVFDRFFRADKARSRDVGGSGLGLSIVRSICHAHGGDVIVESREGQGTTVTVRLPYEGDKRSGIIEDLKRTIKTGRIKLSGHLTDG